MAKPERGVQEAGQDDCPGSQVTKGQTCGKSQETSGCSGCGGLSFSQGQKGASAAARGRPKVSRARRPPSQSWETAAKDFGLTCYMNF